MSVHPKLVDPRRRSQRWQFATAGRWQVKLASPSLEFHRVQNNNAIINRLKQKNDLFRGDHIDIKILQNVPDSFAEPCRPTRLRHSRGLKPSSGTLWHTAGWIHHKWPKGNRRQPAGDTVLKDSIAKLSHCRRVTCPGPKHAVTPTCCHQIPAGLDTLSRYHWRHHHNKSSHLQEEEEPPHLTMSIQPSLEHSRTIIFIHRTKALWVLTCKSNVNDYCNNNI